MSRPAAARRPAEDDRRQREREKKKRAPGDDSVPAGGDGRRLTRPAVISAEKYATAYGDTPGLDR